MSVHGFDIQLASDGGCYYLSGAIEFNNANQAEEAGARLLGAVRPETGLVVLNLAHFKSANTVSVAVFSLWEKLLAANNIRLKLEQVSESLRAILLASRRASLLFD